jgi:hypothetical protein
MPVGRQLSPIIWPFAATSLAGNQVSTLDASATLALPAEEAELTAAPLLLNNQATDRLVIIF